MTLMVDDGSARTINWASMSITWKTGGGTAPTPQYDPATHAVREVAPVEGAQQWEVYALPAEDVSANQAAAAQALQ